jgi:hypothetical protein
MHRLLTAPLIATVALIITGSAVSAQNAFPAPLPGQVGQPPANSGAPSATIVTPPAASFPSTGAPPIGAIGSTQMPQASAECADGYAHLRDEAENRRKIDRGSPRAPSAAGRGLQAAHKLPRSRGKADQVCRGECRNMRNPGADCEPVERQSQENRGPAAEGLYAGAGPAEACTRRPHRRFLAYIDRRADLSGT